MKKNRGFAATILVIITAIAFAGAIIYLQKSHPGKGKLPSFPDINSLKGMISGKTPTPPPGDAPVVKAGSDVAVKSSQTSVKLSGSATDPDGGPLYYEWVKLSGGNANIVSPKSATTTITGLKKGLYVFRLIASDATGLKSADDLFVAVGSVPGVSISNTSSSSGSTGSSGGTSGQTTQQSGYTIAQTSSHASQSDCWLIISNKVYDVTPFISQHPGGRSQITSRCGTDVTTAFNGGVYNHSSYARSLLPTYYKGALN